MGPVTYGRTVMWAKLRLITYMLKNLFQYFVYSQCFNSDHCQTYTDIMFVGEKYNLMIGTVYSKV